MQSVEESSMSNSTSLTAKVLDKGEVTLLNRMGGDKTVVAAARVSNGVTYEESLNQGARDEKLINYLIKHRHGTPFEHATFQFYVKAPLFVRSEWHRHRMASYNEISGRYVEYDPEFYIPDRVRVPAPSNKQGSIFIGNYVEEREKALLTTIESMSLDAYHNYMWLLDQNFAKEMARMILPLNLYTQFYVTINARSLMNFLSLRAAEDAQWEIRQYALAMKEMFKEAMPMTYSAWEQNGFIAP